MSNALKRCSSGDKCLHPDGPVLPATSDYFNKDKYRNDGFKIYCRHCDKKRTKDWRDKTPDHQREYSRQYRIDNADRIRDSKRDYRLRNHDTILAKHREYNRVHRDRMIQSKQDYKQRHPEQYRLQIKESGQRFHKRHPQKRQIIVLERRARRWGAVSDFTLETWFRCLNYFDWKCAVCERDIKSPLYIASPDHWIPLSKGGANTALNIVPLCHGANGCNNHKAAKLPFEWLSEELGEEKALIKLAQIEAYFEWVKKQV